MLSLFVEDAFMRECVIVVSARIKFVYCFMMKFGDFGLGLNDFCVFLSDLMCVLYVCLNFG